MYEYQFKMKNINSSQSIHLSVFKWVSQSVNELAKLFSHSFSQSVSQSVSQ